MAKDFDARTSHLLNHLKQLCDYPQIMRHHGTAGHRKNGSCLCDPLPLCEKIDARIVQHSMQHQLYNIHTIPNGSKPIL